MAVDNELRKRDKEIGKLLREDGKNFMSLTRVL